jgi:M6 family metalloprotease-like protein
LKYKNQWETGFGFPRSSNRLPNVGLIKAIFIFVDFSDAPGTDQPAVVAKTYFEEFNEYYKSVSYGKVSFSYSVPDRYFRINKPSNSYRMNMKKGEQNPDPASYFQDALKAADPTVDFSGFDVVYVIPSNTNTEIVYGPAFPMGLGNETLKTDEKTFYSGAVAGTDSRLQENSLEWVWLAHETGHLFGLEHPWKVQSTPQGATTIGPEVAIWDLMLAMWKFSPKAHEFLGWTRFLMSWISDDQVNCQDVSSISNGDFEFKLTPIEVNTPTDKLAIIRLSETKALVIEVRRNLGFDKIPAEYEGTLMYLVDVTKGSNEGMATLVSSNTRLVNGISIGTMKAGNSVEVANIRIEVVFSNDQGDYIRVTKK